MKITSHLIDRKIMGVNIGVELTIGEYMSFAPSILDKNEFQRRKVKSAGKTYDLLARDLIHGCVIPPIILAVTSAYAPQLNQLVADAIAEPGTFREWDAIDKAILEAITDKELLILDGLQRTLTIDSIISGRDPALSTTDLATFLTHSIRLEIYAGLSKTGILYRMLTLNTGQTPMSFRHQLEILYHDYIDNRDLPDGIEVLKEVDDRRARGPGRYRYSDVVDLFYAFSTGTPMPFDKQALVGELREMNFLEGYTFDAEGDQMQDLLVLYNHMVVRLNTLSGNWTYSPDAEDEGAIVRPFGANIPAIFARTQPMAGFGAEVKRLLQVKAISSIGELRDIVETITFDDDPDLALSQLLKILNEIASKAKRIGDAQRAYFQFAFRSLLLKDSQSFGDASQCWLSGQETYEMMY